MAGLSDRQYRAVLDLVGEAHDAQDLDELRSLLLPALSRLVPADYASYNEVTDDGAAPVTITEPELPKAAHEAWSRHALENPLLARFISTRDTRPYRFSDVATPAELQATELYRALYRPLGIEHQIAFGLPSPPSLTIGVALSRGGRRDFGEDERAMLDLARPHLIQAYRNAQLRERSTALVEALRAGLDAGETAAIVLDRAGRTALATARARELAGPALRPAGDPPALSALASAGILVKRVPAQGGMTVVLLERAAEALAPASLRLLGLTPREAEVLAAFARGRSTEETASALGISRRTVHKHSERVYAKLGVSDRAAAVATAWSATGAALDRQSHL